jgi:hypothetical protein
MITIENNKNSELWEKTSSFAFENKNIDFLQTTAVGHDHCRGEWVFHG